MKKFTINTGDVLALGDHRLLCADCRDREMIAAFLKGYRIAQILTDPPYGIAYVENKASFNKGKIKHEPIANDHIQSEENYRAFTSAWLLAARPFLAPKNSAYIFGSDRMLFAVRGGMEDADFHFGQMLFWLKTSSVLGRLDYLPSHELIFYGWHKAHAFLKSKDQSILVCPKPLRSPFHSTMKPVALLRRLILNNTRIGDIIYDPFVGSGSCILAAEQTKRRCIAVEISPDYCMIAAERFQKLTGIEPKLISSSQL